MTIEKLPSGSYRITQQDHGKRYRITLDHRPTNAEAVRLISQQIERRPRNVADMTLKDACNTYIDAKRNILSPATVRVYEGYVRTLPEDMATKNILQISALDIQRFVNDYSVGRSPKTVANYAHFVNCVLKSVDIDLKTPTLPQKIKKPPYIPTEDEVKAVFEHIKGTIYEVPLTLAIFGLRRSEICALTVEDLSETNTLTINKALVLNNEHKWVIKPNKTTDSTRTIIIPDYLADMIREQGFIFKGYPETLYHRLKVAQKKAGVPNFSMHKLRHFFASYLHQKGYTNKQIQEMGGWKTDIVLKTVYQHAMNMDEAKRNMANDIGDIFS